MRTPSFPEVVFARSGLTVEWDPRCSSLLELAEAHGLRPDHMCRVGACNTCLTRLVQGDVEYMRELLVLPAPGEVLICCSRPRTRVVVDV